MPERTAGLAALIRIDAAWLAVKPMDTRAGPDTALARVVAVIDAAQQHHAYVFANARATRMGALVLGLPWQRVGHTGAITLV